MKICKRIFMAFGQNPMWRDRTEGYDMVQGEIDEKALEAAADMLNEIGAHHGWWKPVTKSWRESDPIAREEFLDIVWLVVKAYKKQESSK